MEISKFVWLIGVGGGRFAGEGAGCTVGTGTEAGAIGVLAEASVGLLVPDAGMPLPEEIGFVF